MDVIFSAASHQCYGLCVRKFEVRELVVILNKALAIDIRLRAILPGYREKGLFWFSLDGEQSLSHISLKASNPGGSLNKCYKGRLLSKSNPFWRNRYLYSPYIHTHSLLHNYKRRDQARIVELLDDLRCILNGCKAQHSSNSCFKKLSMKNYFF